MSIMASLNNVYYRNRLLIYPLTIAIGMPLVIMSLLSLLYKTDDIGITRSFHDLLGDWAYWIIIIGLSLSLFGIYNIFKFFQQLKEYKELIDTPSKAKFIKNLDRIEELAWKLHPKYERQAIEQKKKFHIK